MSRASTGSPSARTMSALRMSPGAGTSRAMRTLPVDRPESVTAMSPVMSGVCVRSPAMTVGAPRPPPTHTARRGSFTGRILADMQEGTPVARRAGYEANGYRPVLGLAVRHRRRRRAAGDHDRVVFTITAERSAVHAAVQPGDELRVSRDGNMEIAPTGVPALMEQLGKAMEELKRKWFGQ